ncbi:hypothetical protein Ciccas_014534, partial [Cichlidogyrus casuarinus]
MENALQQEERFAMQKENSLKEEERDAFWFESWLWIFFSLEPPAKLIITNDAICSNLQLIWSHSAMIAERPKLFE